MRSDSAATPGTCALDSQGAADHRLRTTVQQDTEDFAK